MTPDDKEMHEEILALRQEFNATRNREVSVISESLLRALALREDEGLPWRLVADRLNAEGLRTERGLPWSWVNIRNHLNRRKLYIDPKTRIERVRERSKTQPRKNGRWTK